MPSTPEMYSGPFLNSPSVHKSMSYECQRFGESALQFAARTNNYVLMKTLIEQKANVNEVMRNGSTLQIAIDNYNRECCRMLLEHKANVNVKFIGGYTAFHSACRKGDFRMVTDLLDHGANPHEKNNYVSNLLGLVSKIIN
jgi:ankyrin repeat protein